MELIRLSYDRKKNSFRVYGSEFGLSSVVRLTPVFSANDSSDVEREARDLQSTYPVNAYLLDSKGCRARLYFLSKEEYVQSIEVRKLVEDERLR
ncbi:hypothetical protein J4429_01520 [Candidatus Pacearchaeota archaeon]|nr:hypothetical protein [Candidatus Pacearchaeota archaeon]